jgi:hypothetical protein
MHAHSRTGPGSRCPVRCCGRKPRGEPPAQCSHGATRRRLRSATFERPASARRPPSLATTAGSRRTASMTWSATSGNGAQPTPRPGDMNSRAAPSPALSFEASHLHGMMQTTSCRTTTQGSDALAHLISWPMRYMTPARLPCDPNGRSDHGFGFPPRVSIGQNMCPARHLLMSSAGASFISHSWKATIWSANSLCRGTN